MIFQKSFKIISNNKITDNCYRLEILSPEIAKTAEPGQFVHIRIEDTYRPFLRRPFAVCRLKNKEVFEILYKVRGLGTRILSSKKRGDRLDIIGPLGKGFEIRDIDKEALVVAGGIGIAPLFFLINRLKEQNRKITTFIGASCKGNLLLYEDIKRLNIKSIIATEDGSLGRKAKVTEVLTEFLERIGSNSDYEVFASGPKEMLKVIAKSCQRLDIPAQLSLDEMIACGVGVCLGCSVKTKQGYKLVCKDGPVFRADDLLWD